MIWLQCVNKCLEQHAKQLHFKTNFMNRKLILKMNLLLLCYNTNGKITLSLSKRMRK